MDTQSDAAKANLSTKDDKTELLRQITNLTIENHRLKKLLTRNGIDFSSACENDLSQTIITARKLKLFASLFRGRTDVYSRRSSFPNPKTGKCGYFAQIDYASSGRRYLPLTYQDLLRHLKGEKADCSDVIGIYPVLPNETCYFLVLDFDDHVGANDLKIKQDVTNLRQICEENQIGHLVERSRSGKGYHMWFFFETEMPVYLAREFGSALLIKSAEKISYADFNFFDRMIPASDFLPINHKTGLKGIGNIVALPLQGQAIRRGNSVFIDENWQPYKDQWQVLATVIKLPREFLERKILEWGTIRNPQIEDEAPWEARNAAFSKHDVDGKVEIVLADGIYIDKNNLRPCFQNQLRRLAAFNNANFYKKQAIGLPVFGIPRIVYAGEDISHFIRLPFGLCETLFHKLEEVGIEYNLSDKRNCGQKIKVKFTGKLYPEQKVAAQKILCHDNGVLSAATAFGKTVLGAYLIAKRKTNTLILVHNYEIMKNWQQDLEKFLVINHEIPEKLTPKGRKKKLKSLVGTLKAGSDMTTGIVDIAMISSLGRPGQINEIVKNYGMVIMDECHHSPTKTADSVLREINSKYLYGLTATPIRDDGLDKKIFMLLGPLRHKYTAKDRANKTQFNYVLRVQKTNFNSHQKEIYEVYHELINDETRNQQIITDVINLVKNGKTPIVVTKFRDHARYLYEKIKDTFPQTFLMIGGEKSEEVLKRMNLVSGSLILVATGRLIGEGFNFPKLDSLIMATPVSFKGIVEQYAGRINRDYPGKKEVVILDYLDENVPMLTRMYKRRKTTYKELGYKIEEMF